MPARRRLIVPAIIAAFLLSSIVSYAPVIHASATALVPAGFRGFTATVIGDVCNLRTSPGTNAQIIGTLARGTVVGVVDFQDNWAKIDSNGQEGWIAGWLLDINLTTSAVQVRATHVGVNLREGPDTSYSVKSMASKDSLYPAEVKRGEWIRITLPGGGTAWVSESLVQLEWPERLQAPESFQPGDIVVRPLADTLVVRATAAADSPVIRRINRNESATVLNCVGAWIAVELSTGMRGWVYGPEATVNCDSDPSLSISISDAAWSLRTYPTTKVTHTDVNLRSGAGTSYPILSTLSNGDVLRVLETQGDWTKAISPKGITGWVASYLTSGTAVAPAGLSVTLEGLDNARSLTVAGPFESAKVTKGTGEESVTVTLSQSLDISTAVPVGAYGLVQLTIDGSDITLSLTSGTTYTVASNVQGKVIIGLAGSPPNSSSAGETASSGSSPGAGLPAGSEAPKLGNGNAGTYVAQLQGTLATLGYYTGKIDGDFGPLTATALKEFQSANGLGATGTTDNTTWEALSKGIQVSRSAGILSRKTIVIDPGHGGSDPGVISSTGIEEEDLTLPVALKVRAYLESQGAKVIMTRTGDSTPGAGWATPMGDLASRVYLANSSKADAFVSIHINSYPKDKRVSGIIGFYCPGSAISQQLSASVAGSVSNATGLSLDGNKTANYYVLVNTAMPATLLELGFMTNANDVAHLVQTSFQDTAARAISQGIAAFFGR